MSGPGTTRSVWGRLPITLRAIVAGLAIGLIGANVWSLLLLAFGLLLLSNEITLLNQYSFQAPFNL